MALVQVHRDTDGVARVELNRPERRNALTGPLADELAEALERLNDDDAIGVIVLSGAGGAFCSGLDLKEFSAEPRPAWVPDFSAKWLRVHCALFESSKIVVGALERAAVNGGAALALACDFLVVGGQSFLQVGEIQQGMAAPMNMSWLRLRHTEAIAGRIALLGDRIYGEELVNLGVAYACVADADVLAEANRLARRLASHDRTGAARIKVSLRRSLVTDSAHEWFQRSLDADPLPGTRRVPVAAVDGDSRAIAEPEVCLLHIGKTGGTFLKQLIAHNESARSPRLQVMTHAATMASTSRDFGSNREVVFVFRDPIERFLSGFDSRVRAGRPQYNSFWTAKEAIAFAMFPSAVELAESLGSQDPHRRSGAEYSMRSISHLVRNYGYYFASPEQFVRQQAKIRYCVELADLDTQLDQVMASLGFDSYDLPPDVPRHGSPAPLSQISERGRNNLREFWSEEFELYEMMKQLVSDRRFA